jgi:hypothetical protein
VTDATDSERTESLIDLPDAVDGDFDVYVNGILQQPGPDYTVDGRTLVFPRLLQPEIAMSKLQLLRALLGIAGTYRKHDSVDVAFQHAGRRLVATGLAPRNRDESQP